MEDVANLRDELERILVLLEELLEEELVEERRQRERHLDLQQIVLRVSDMLRHLQLMYLQ